MIKFLFNRVHYLARSDAGDATQAALDGKVRAQNGLNDMTISQRDDLMWASRFDASIAVFCVFIAFRHFACWLDC